MNDDLVLIVYCQIVSILMYPMYLLTKEVFRIRITTTSHMVVSHIVWERKGLLNALREFVLILYSGLSLNHFL